MGLQRVRHEQLSLTFHIRWLQYWSFNFSISLSIEYSGLISFRIDWFYLLAIQGILMSLIQHHSSKVSILWCSAFFLLIFFKFYFFWVFNISLFLSFFNFYFYYILLYNTVLVLPYIDMNQPWVYMSSQPWTPAPTSHPISSLWIIPMHQPQASCILHQT